MKFSFPDIGQAISEDEQFVNNDHIRVYSPWGGADNHMGSYQFQKHVFCHLAICCKFFPLKAFVIVSTFK